MNSTEVLPFTAAEAIDEALPFLAAIFDPEDIIEFMACRAGAAGVPRYWETIETSIEALEGLYAANVRNNAFFGANPRKPEAKARQGGKVEDVALARCMFVDFDSATDGSKGLTADHAIDRIADAHLPPATALLHTGCGVHAYWRLDEPLTDLADWTQRQKALIRLLRSDGTIHNPNRLMRLPGFANIKHAGRPKCRLIDCDSRRTYSLFEFPAPLKEPPAPRKASTTPGSMSRLSRRFVESGYVPLGIGSRRMTMFTVACDLKARGWALPDAETLIMDQVQRLDLSTEDIADCPRQIRNAFAAPRTPLADDDEPDVVSVPDDHSGHVEAATGDRAALIAKPVAMLITEHRELRQPLIQGLLRVGETMNVIAAPKTGKSWLVMDLCLSMAAGRPWLDTYQTTQGRVLVLDNELHEETTAVRMRHVTDHRRYPTSALEDVHVINLRGKLLSIHGVCRYLATLERGAYSLVVLDAFYRFMPADCDENSNGEMASLYNLLDLASDKLRAAIVCVHHTSKGGQSEKSVTDVGAGAGAQSRAVDTHLVLRPHREPGAIVLDAATRSWAPIQPRSYRWNWPLWSPADDLDPNELRGAPKRAGSSVVGKATEATVIAPAWTARRVLDEIIGGRSVSKDDVIRALCESGETVRRSRELWNEIKGGLTSSRNRNEITYSIGGLHGTN